VFSQVGDEVQALVRRGDVEQIASFQGQFRNQRIALRARAAVGRSLK
jgi:hypothetical protein